MLGTQRILRVVMYGNIITLWVVQGLNRVGKRGVRLHQVMVVLDWPIFGQAREPPRSMTLRTCYVPH